MEAEEKKCRIPEEFPSVLKRCEMDLEVAYLNSRGKSLERMEVLALLIPGYTACRRR